MPFAPRWKPIFSASCDVTILANGVSQQVLRLKIRYSEHLKPRSKLVKMSLQVIIGLSMVAVGLALATYVIVLIFRERRRDRNIID